MATETRTLVRNDNGDESVLTAAEVEMFASRIARGELVVTGTVDVEVPDPDVAADAPPEAAVDADLTVS